MKANTPQSKTQPSIQIQYTCKKINDIWYHRNCGNHQKQTPESEKIDPDRGLGEPQPQTSAKATLRLDEAGRSQLTLVIGKFAQ